MKKIDIFLSSFGILKSFFKAAAVFLFALSVNSHARVDSEYTPKIRAWMKSWPISEAPVIKKYEDIPSDKIDLECYEHPKENLYVGVRQIFWVKAPLSDVEKVLDDFDNYRVIFPDIKEVKVAGRKQITGPDPFEEIDTHWETKIPVFFIPNVHYGMIYEKRKKSETSKSYFYQLDKECDIMKSDGAIFLDEFSFEKEPGKILKATRYVEFDFAFAKWGIAKSMGEKKIWHESLQGIIQSDWSIILKAEKKMESKKILDESEEMTDKFSDKPMDECIRHKKKII